MNEGDRLAAAKDWQGALTRYTSAHAIMRVPSTGAAAAGAHLELGHLLEARDLCLAVQRFPRAATEAAAFTSARQQCEGVLGQVEGRLASLRFVVQGLPAETVATVRVDGAQVPPAALLVPRRVDPGKHVVIASAPGKTDVGETFSVREGETKEVKLVFAEGPPLATGPQKAAGPRVEEASGESAKGRSSPSTPTWIALGAGAAGLLVGGVAGGLSFARAGDAKSGCVDNLCPRGNREDADSARTLGNVSNIGFVVGAVGVATGVVLWLASSKRADAPNTATFARAGVPLGGSF